MNLQESIKQNQHRQDKYKFAAKVLHHLRLFYFDYEDQGKAEKANKLMQRCQNILQPLKDCIRKNRSTEQKPLPTKEQTNEDRLEENQMRSL